jgi:hypothetical protein
VLILGVFTATSLYFDVFMVPFPSVYPEIKAFTYATLFKWKMVEKCIYALISPKYRPLALI